MPAIVEIVPSVYRIPTLGDFINTFVFVETDGSVTLVDTGLKKAPPKIVAGLAAIGKSPADVQCIVLTHAHSDHAGGAADLVQQAALTGVAIHEADAEFIEEGFAPPLDQSLISARVLTRLPRASFDPVQVSERLTDGQLLDVAGGLRVHHTPGHSPGHTSLVHEPTRTMITGDAIWNMASRMTWPVPQFCTSVKLNKQSAHVLGELEYDIVGFTHGPHIDTNAREAVRGFLRKKQA